ncbi:MAG: hypothetical protein WCK25_01700 [Actinomycetes bacterium]
MTRGDYFDEGGGKKTATRATSATAMITTVTMKKAIPRRELPW